MQIRCVRDEVVWVLGMAGGGGLGEEFECMGGLGLVVWGMEGMSCERMLCYVAEDGIRREGGGHVGGWVWL